MAVSVIGVIGCPAIVAFSLFLLSLSLSSPSLSLSLSLSSLSSLTSLKVELNDLPFVHPLPLK